VTIHGKSGHLKQSIVRLALGFDGARDAALEALPLDRLHAAPPGQVAPLDGHALQSMLTEHAPQVLHRDFEYRGNLAEGAWYLSRLLGVVLVP
jgi:hypothetical protein